jgi:asparagine synthase (glutamine-hydrolysing)
VVAERDRIPYDDAFRRRFRDVLTDAVRVRLRSDVTVGATLSGGLDSSTIVLLVNELTGGAPMHLFTSLYPETAHDETPFFDAVVERMWQPVVHHAQPDPARFRDDLVQVLRHQEEPFGDTSILAHFSLMRAARDAGVPVVLSGQGGDELLLGYPSMVSAYLGSLLARGNVGALRQAWRYAPGVGMSHAAAVRNVLGAALPLPIRDRVRQRFVRRMAAHVTPNLLESVSLWRFTPDDRDMLSSYLRQVFTRFAIPHLTHYDDRNAMAFSVEGRMPFLDTRLVELMGSVRRDAMFANGFTKRVLRESFADLLPESVRLRRDKVGFHTPMASWLRKNGQWLAGFMTTDRLSESGLLKPSAYGEAVAQLNAGDSGRAQEVWRGFILHLWMDQFSLYGNTIVGEAA